MKTPKRNLVLNSKANNFFRNADTLVQFGIQDRLNEINHVDGQSYLCTMGQNGIFDTAKEAVEFLPDVLVTNFRGPTMSMVSLYNDFIHGKNFNI